jgi:hypothetical protein
MERRALDESQAFSCLVEESQRTQVKLRLIAGSLVEEANRRRGSSPRNDNRPQGRNGENSSLRPA